MPCVCGVGPDPAEQPRQGHEKNNDKMERSLGPGAVAEAPIVADIAAPASSQVGVAAKPKGLRPGAKAKSMPALATATSLGPKAPAASPVASSKAAAPPPHPHHPPRPSRAKKLRVGAPRRCLLARRLPPQRCRPPWVASAVYPGGSNVASPYLVGSAGLSGAGPQGGTAAKRAKKEGGPGGRARAMASFKSTSASILRTASMPSPMQ